MNLTNRFVQRLALAMSLLAMGFGLSVAHAVTYEMVTVGDAGNAADTTGYGAVNYEYKIGKYEVTIGQYVDFLNAVLRTDPGSYEDSGTPGGWHPGTLALWNNFNSDGTQGISRSGSPGSFHYTAYLPTPGPGLAYPAGADSPTDRPVNVSWESAYRFVNWMNNGQPTGEPGPTTTEDGLYPLFGAVTGPGGGPQPHDLPKRSINPNTGAAPIYRIPTESEWYKAAYYKGGGTDSGYWQYATQSDSLPGKAIGSESNQANYWLWGFNSSGFYETYGNAVWSGYGFELGNFYGLSDLTNVGAFTGTPSAYGTFDQSGNLSEITDGSGFDINGRPAGAGVDTVLRGGGYRDNYNLLQSAWRGTSLYGVWGGFRLASPVAVPEPSTYALVLAGLACGGYSLFRRRRAR